MAGDYWSADYKKRLVDDLDDAAADIIALKTKRNALFARVLELEAQRDELLAACEAETQADVHPVSCSWCQESVGGVLRCREWYRLRDAAKVLRQAALAAAKGE